VNRFARRYSSNPLLCAVLLAALVIRALIPAGFMPGGGSGFSMALKLCHGMEMGTLPIHGDEPQSPAPASHKDAPCVFAALASAAPLPELLQITAYSRPVDSAVANDVFGIITTSIVRAQSARAPPPLRLA